MSLVPRPTWEPLPDPPGPDPDAATAFQSLAEEHMASLDAFDAPAGEQAASMSEATEQGLAVLDGVGADLGAGAELLSAMEREAVGDTLESELRMAGEQDAAIAAVTGDVAGAIGEPTLATGGVALTGEGGGEVALAESDPFKRVWWPP